MFDVGNKVKVRCKGVPYLGVVRQIKWGLAFVDFHGERRSEWISIARLERVNENETPQSG